MSSEPPVSSLSFWLARHAAADPAALDGILCHCQDQLKRHVRRILRGFPDVARWEETSDVLQDVNRRLIKALRGKLQGHSFGTPTDFYCVASQHVRWALLELSRRPHVELFPGQSPEGSSTSLEQSPAAPPEDPYNLARWHEIHTWIEQLPEEDRRLFDLLYYQELSQDEAAEILGVSLSTLRRQWQSLRLRRQRLFGNEDSF